MIEAQPKNKGLVAPPENILIHFFGSRDFSWVASSNLFDFKENYDKMYKPNQKTKYYQTAVQLASDPELRAADQARFEENELLYKNSMAAKNAEKAEKKKAKKLEKELELRKKEEEDYNQEVSNLKNSRKRKDSLQPPGKKKEKTSVAKIINNQTLLPKEKKSSLENLLRLRVKLQKFINSQTKTEQDFVKVDAYMKEAEEFPVDYQLFKESKIGKVLKFVSKLELPQDSFDIVNRAHILMNKWRSILQDQVNDHSNDQITNFVESVIKESLNDLSDLGEKESKTLVVEQDSVEIESNSEMVMDSTAETVGQGSMESTAETVEKDSMELNVKEVEQSSTESKIELVDQNSSDLE